MNALDRPQTCPETGHDPAEHLDAGTKAFYLRALDIVEAAGVPYVVAGAYALAYHADIVRHTKDLDLFVRRSDVACLLTTFEAAGYRTERTHPHWLAKVFCDEHDAFVDFIFRSANGLCDVDDEWLSHAVPGQVLTRPAPLCAAEEVIWSKSFVCARERFDGADINHLIRARGDTLDWDRLLHRFTGYEEVLLAHLMMYRFVYPGERDRVPQRVLDRLTEIDRARPQAEGKVCRGTMLTWDQYQVDLCQWGYQDARILPGGHLTTAEVDEWTRAPK
ncbi:MAG TPA: nucleotidyltransferase family protein [Tepidisphaeraceae bacterium]|nr:nucleotidyltransferase family protein [Tepidisphaeraceae bacterium]